MSPLAHADRAVAQHVSHHIFTGLFFTVLLPYGQQLLGYVNLAVTTQVTMD